MNATACGISVWIKSRLRWPVLGLAILGLLSGGQASAGAIRLHALGIPEKGETTPEYFERMLQEHVTKISVAELDQGRRTLHAEADGTLPDTSFVEYLRWRQSLDVERFDANHPVIAAMMRKDASVRALQVAPQQLTTTPSLTAPPTTPTLSAETVTTPPPSSPPYTATSPYVPPSTVPEPGTGLMALALIGSAALARRWARRLP